MVREIPTARLTEEDVPPENASWDLIERFALTFDGYEHAGSFEACAAIAKARRHDTLDDLRTCLFFEQRSHRFAGWPPEGDALEYVRELVRKIRERVAGTGKKPRRRRQRCPQCDGAERVVAIVYGYPTRGAERAHARGEIMLGGCCVDDDSPAWHCRRCNVSFGRRGDGWSEPCPGPGLRLATKVDSSGPE